MEEKLTAHLFLMGLFAAVIAAVITTGVFGNSFKKQVQSDLQNSGTLIAAAYDDIDDYSELGKFGNNLRITLIKPDGTVLFDSTEEITALDNHKNRPEVASAIQNGAGNSVRRSDTKMADEYYYAVRLTDGKILRVSIEAQSVFDTFSAAYPAVLGLVVLVLIAAIILAVLLTRKIVRPINRLAENIDGIDVNDDKIYPELAPFIEEIQSQRAKNRTQLKKLAGEQEKLTAIMESMSEGLVILDSEKKVLMINESAESYLGCGSESQRKNIVYVTRNREIIDCVDAAAGGENSMATISLDGRKLQIMASPVETANMHMGVICFILDVTEKMQIEKMKQEFTANVSHELKTPLTSISGYAELIETGIAKDEDIIGFATKIHKEAGRLLTLISDIIRLSELDEIQLTDEVEQVDLMEIANECVATLALSAEKHKVSLIAEGVHSYVLGNKSMLNELVYNLCDNAIRYNKEGGSVTVSVGEKKLCVSDTGIGIPTKYQHRVFERFYRVDKSRSKETGGTGLGLAIVKHIAKQHGAEVRLNSIEGSGTEITVEF